MSTVTLNGSRVNDADTNTGWSNLGGGGPSPASEAQLRYQGAGAVNRKVTTTASLTGVQYDAGSTIDMTGASFPLWLFKGKVADAGDLNTTYGLQAAIGSGSGAAYQYNLSGSGANNPAYDSGYSSQGGLAEGYVITAINPNIAQWREATVGSPVLTAVDYYGIAAQLVVGGAKSENVALDAIDVGLGLDYTGTSFTFQDGVTTDQENTSNRWGFACANGSDLQFRGVHTVGAGGVLTSGTDTSSVRFPDGYHGTGDAGIEVDLSNASTILTFNGSYVGLGALYTADDTRPDLLVTGTSGTLDIGGDFLNFNAITLTSAVTVADATLEFVSLSPSTADIDNSTLGVDTAASTAGTTDPSFANMAGIRWVQLGVGHAIEITSTGTYTLDATTFIGFGADASTSAAIYNNSGGLVTLNVVNGGGTPTVTNGSGASTTINNAAAISLTGLIAGSRVYIENTTDSVVLFNEIEATTAFADSVNYTADKALLVKVRNASGVTKYKPFETTGTLTSAGFSLVVNQELDE